MLQRRVSAASGGFFELDAQQARHCMWRLSHLAECRSVLFIQPLGAPLSRLARRFSYERQYWRSSCMLLISHWPDSVAHRTGGKMLVLPAACSPRYSQAFRRTEKNASLIKAASRNRWRSLARFVENSVRFYGHFPGEPGLAGVYWSKGWWTWSYKSCEAPVRSSPTNQHPVFLQARCPSCCPTNSVKALKGKYHIPGLAYPKLTWGSSNFVSNH